MVFKSRIRNSIRGFVCLSVGPSIHWSVTIESKSDKNAHQRPCHPIHDDVVTCNPESLASVSEVGLTFDLHNVGLLTMFISAQTLNHQITKIPSVF